MDSRKGVWSNPIHPLFSHSLLEEIYQKYSSEDQRLHACADIYVNCHPEPSWTDLCSRLSYNKEVTAARKAKIFIPQTGR